MTTFVRRAAWTILAAGFLSAAPRAADVSGRILGDGAKPVARAVVRLLPETAIASKRGRVVRVETGDDGDFVASGLTGGRFRIRVDAPGYAPLTQPDIPAGASVQLRLRRGAKLSGIVRDRASHAAIGAATVLAWDKDAEPFGEEAYRKGTSGKDGAFVVADLLPGKVTVEARAKGHATGKSGNVTIPKMDLELLLDVSGGLTGLVTDTSGDPVAGAEVKASWRDATGARSRSAKTGADGHYRIADAASLPLTRVTVTASKFLVATHEGSAPAEGVLDFVLEHGGSIAGIVRAYDEKVPTSFRVKVSVLEGSASREVSEHEFSDADGAFHIDDLDPGTYSIEVRADRYASVSKSDLDVLPEQIADAGTLTLGSRSALRGRVVAARDRAPVPGVTVEIALVEGAGHAAPAAGAMTSWTETTASDGTFATKELPEGSFDVIAKHPQFAPVTTRISFRPDADTPELVLELSRGGSLTGTVLNGKQEPVLGVTIVAAPGTGGDPLLANTGPDGRYFMDGLAPGTYTVTRQQENQASAPGIDAKVALIREGETTTVDFDERPRVTVRGIVMKGGSPMSDAAIHFVSTDGDPPRSAASTRSDGEGGFQVGLRRGGRYQVSVVFGVEGASNSHNVVTLTIPDQPEVSQNIVFNVLAIAGHVIDPERKGVKGALVQAFRDGAPPGVSPQQSTTTTIDDGSFRLEAVDAGTYRVNARARGFAAGEAYPVVVSDDAQDAEVELSLDRGWIMRGRLLDPEGRPVPGALVVVAPPGTAESGYLPAQTDTGGAFRITAPADGPVSVAAISPRFAPAVLDNVEQPPNDDSSEVVLHASAGGTIRVRVVHRSGDPAPGVVVAYQPVPLFPGCDVVVERNRPRSTDADGMTQVTMVHPGSYVVSIAGRRGVGAVQVDVFEGQESSAVLEVP